MHIQDDPVTRIIDQFLGGGYENSVICKQLIPRITNVQ